MENKNKGLLLRLTKSELDNIKNKANEAGFTSTSKYCRSILKGSELDNGHLTNISKLSDSLMVNKNELRSIGNNLNQIAKKLNSGENVGNVKSVLDECKLAILEIEYSLIYLRGVIS